MTAQVNLRKRREKKKRRRTSKVKLTRNVNDIYINTRTKKELGDRRLQEATDRLMMLFYKLDHFYVIYAFRFVNLSAYTMLWCSDRFVCALACKLFISAAQTFE